MICLSTSSVYLHASARSRHPQLVREVEVVEKEGVEEEEEEEEEEETVFIRGVNTNEDSPNAQHAPHRPRTGHRCNECVASVHA